MKQETLTDKARALSNLISEKAKRLDTLKRVGRELEARCNNKRVVFGVALVYEIALYCMVLSHHEPDLLRLQFSASNEREGLFSIADRLTAYAGVCDRYHRHVLHDEGVPVKHIEWVFKEPDTPPTFPKRIVVPANCFTPVTTR